MDEVISSGRERGAVDFREKLFHGECKTRAQGGRGCANR